MMFDNQYIGWMDHWGFAICCGDYLALRFSGGTRIDGAVKYDTLSCSFVVVSNDGSRFSFSDLSDEGVEISHAC